MIPQGVLRRPPQFRFRYRRSDSRILAEVEDDEFVMELPLEWAFGAGNHGVTFVSRLNRSSYVEHAFSYYAKPGTFDATTGHESIRPESVLQAMGLRYQVRGQGNSISDCFNCHSTGPLSYSSRGEIDVTEKAVRCETCHGPGRGHLEAVSSGDGQLARSSIDNPARLSPDALLQFCGDCHRDPRGAATAFDYERAWNVRHQPPYFRQSPCFQNSGGTLSCVTCHDPHEDVRRNEPRYYRARCMACHDASYRPPSKLCRAGSEDTDCAECHMPEVQVSPHLGFKNHWIGIYADERRLTPSR